MIKKNIIVLGLIGLFINPLSANSTNSVDSGKEYKSSRKTNDLNTKLSIKQREYTRMLNSKGYKIASGSTAASGDFNSETAVDDLYMSFKEAYVIAVTNLLLQETQGYIGSTFKSKTGTNAGSKQSNAQKCISEYELEQERLKKEKEEWDKSFLGTVERIADKFSDQDIAKKEKEISDKENDSLNKMIECSTPFIAKQLEIALNKSVEGGVYGVRIMETLLDIEKKTIGVIVGRSPGSAKDAGILKGQNPVAKPLPTALEEVISKTMEKIDNYEKENREPPFGMFGVQGIKLSNGEMAYISFGTALQKEVISEMDSNSNSLALELADTKSLAALVEFSYMTASSQFQAEMKKVVEEVTTEILDMAKKGKKVNFSTVLNKKLSSTLTRNLQADAEGFLKSPQQIDNSAWSGGDKYPDFYLSVWAWSPSLMTNATRSHESFENAYEEGKTKNDIIEENVIPTKPVEKGIKSYKIEQDW